MNLILQFSYHMHRSIYFICIFYVDLNSISGKENLSYKTIRIESVEVLVRDEIASVGR